MEKDVPGFTGRTLRVWQPRTPRPLTTEDAREIAENVCGFFRVLAEWDTPADTDSADA